MSRIFTAPVNGQKDLPANPTGLDSIIMSAPYIAGRR
jgi:hypothetical protein